jgi:ubiquinone/menaquinone biosynthesis C-methylase UbiE
MTWSDETAASYDAWYQTPVGRLTDAIEKDAVFSLINEAPGLALDLSCGTGNYAFELARRGWRVIGVDRSSAMLRYASGKRDHRSRVPAFVAADAARLPLRDGSVSLVTLILGLEFMTEPAQALNEVHRVLHPGGAAIVAVLPANGLWNLWRRLERRFVPSVWRDARFLRAQDLTRALRASGFRIAGRRSAVHYFSIVRSVRWLSRWERLAATLAPCLASFVTVRCEVGVGGRERSDRRGHATLVA